MTFNESMVEDAALTWFSELGYAVAHGPDLAPGEPASERDGFDDVVLVGRLREAIQRLNSDIPDEAREEALRKVLRVGSPSLMQTNGAFHKMLRDGVEVEYARPDGTVAGDHVRLLDFDDMTANDWLAVNQLTVIEGQNNRRPDIVVFVNGLQLGLIELKNAADEAATIWTAYDQLRTYKAEIPSLMHYNAALVVSDGLEARIGSLMANQEWFKVWRTIDGEGDAPKWAALEALVGDPKRLKLVANDLVAHFEKRVEAMNGKAMIVCMSRRIGVALHEALIKLRPDWAGSDDAEADKGKACVVKVVMKQAELLCADWV
jgi:type I restriction enzyme R subunit